MILVNSRVERMIQAMAGFGTQSTGGVIGSTPDDSKNQWQLAQACDEALKNSEKIDRTLSVYST